MSVVIIKEKEVQEEEFPEINNVPASLKEAHDFFTAEQDELPHYELEPSMFKTTAADSLQKARTNGLR